MDKRFKIEILRGEGHLVLSFVGTFEQAMKVCRWLAKGSHYTIVLDGKVVS